VRNYDSPGPITDYSNFRKRKAGGKLHLGSDAKRRRIVFKSIKFLTKKDLSDTLEKEMAS
jgi:hypothetical protein